MKVVWRLFEGCLDGVCKVSIGCLHVIKRVSGGYKKGFGKVFGALNMFGHKSFVAKIFLEQTVLGQTYFRHKVLFIQNLFELEFFVKKFGPLFFDQISFLSKVCTIVKLLISKILERGFTKIKMKNITCNLSVASLSPICFLLLGAKAPLHLVRLIN